MAWWDPPPDDSQPLRIVLTYAQTSSEVVLQQAQTLSWERLHFCRKNNKRKDAAMFTRCRFPKFVTYQIDTGYRTLLC